MQKHNLQKTKSSKRKPKSFKISSYNSTNNNILSAHLTHKPIQHPLYIYLYTTTKLLVCIQKELKFWRISLFVVVSFFFFPLAPTILPNSIFFWGVNKTSLMHSGIMAKTFVCGDGQVHYIFF
jgi:hypothetical protein